MGFLDRLRKGRPATPADADRLALRHLEIAGADLTKPRHVIHYLYFADEADASAAAEAIGTAGLETTVHPPDDETQKWSVRGENYRVVEPSTVAAFRAQLEQIAAEFRGEYDGWEAAAKP